MFQHLYKKITTLNATSCHVKKKKKRIIIGSVINDYQFRQDMRITQLKNTIYIYIGTLFDRGYSTTNNNNEIPRLNYVAYTHQVLISSFFTIGNLRILDEWNHETDFGETYSGH